MLERKFENIDWQVVTEAMHLRGYEILANILDAESIEKLKSDYNKPELYRKTVVMERYRFGKGEYKYFNYPLPNAIQKIREAIYPYLATIANTWMQVLRLNTVFPDTFSDLQAICIENKQTKATPLILKYGMGGFNTLHQDLYGDVYFPIQAVVFLSQPDLDHKGGEFVMTEQIPRSQSKAIVLKPNKGDILIFTTNFRPVKGSKGYYKVTMKHGVSEVHAGERYTLGIIFHDALT